MRDGLSGRRIAGFRERRGKTQSWLARELGVHPNQVANYEHGRSTPPLIKLMLICRALQVDPMELFQRHEDPDEDYQDARHGQAVRPRDPGAV